MQSRPNRDEPSAAVLADLSALADGTLDPGRESAVRELIAGSPELTKRLDRERRAIAALHATRAGRAPERLRARIDAQRGASERRPEHRPRRRLAYGGAVASALAAVVLALVLVLPAGAPGGPSVSQAASLALRGPAFPPPAPDPRHPADNLSQDVQEIYFPNWSGLFGWRAVGMRKDRLDGRAAVTVYYARAGKQIAYTILASPALRQPSVGMYLVGGTKLQVLTVGGRPVVTWRRSGRTCVLSGAGVSPRVLSELAAWKTAGGS